MKTFLDLWNAFDWLIDPARHFLLSGLLGWLVWLLTSTISFAQLWGLQYFTRKKVSMGVVYGIVISCLLAGLASAWLLHYGLDYIWELYTKPLNPPLNLRLPNG